MGKNRAGKGRAQRIAKRRSGVLENPPAPPGQTGGRYRPLKTTEIRSIFDTALRLLSDPGMGDAPRILEKRAVSKGAFVNTHGRLCFPQDMVRDCINTAAKTITLHGRDPARSITIGETSVYFGTGGAAVQTLDIDSGEYRPSTLKDLYDFTRLQDVLENISWFTRCCIATDIPDSFDLDVNTAFALLKATTKPVATAFSEAKNVAPIVEMFDMATGEKGGFSKRPFCFSHVSPIISPMRYGQDAVKVALACMDHNLPLSCITAAQSGATAPAPLAGFLAQSLAETLASLVFVNLFKPGYPMVFSNWPLVIDLRTGSFSGGGGEISLMNAASAQITNWLGLPSGVACSMSDAKAPDAQMGMEKGISAMATGLAGGNMIYESSGMMASLLGVSFEAFILDNEMHSHIYRVIRGIEVNDDTLGFAAIKHAILGEGHFLGEAHTMAAMQRDYFYPELADRNPPSIWQERGGRDIKHPARDRARQILHDHVPSYLSPQAENLIRSKFNILLE